MASIVVLTAGCSSGGSDDVTTDGPTTSEVILSAADRGFVGEGYQDVYTNYENHAEEVLERDEVPPGYRFYVRRYFQLIRPREGAPQTQAEPESGQE